MPRSPKQQAFIRNVRLTAKREAIQLALSYFHTLSYPVAVERLQEKLRQYEAQEREP